MKHIIEFLLYSFLYQNIVQVVSTICKEEEEKADFRSILNRQGSYTKCPQLQVSKLSLKFSGLGLPFKKTEMTSTNECACFIST